MGRSPSMITTEPFFFSAIRFDTSATVAEAVAVIAGELITSATVRTVSVAGMTETLPTPAPLGPGSSESVHRPATCWSPRRAPPVTPGRDGRHVNPLTTFVRSLGNEGARRNATAAVEASIREDWLVQGLARRLEQRSPQPVTTTRPAAAAAA
jgi:hypothetical protein